MPVVQVMTYAALLAGLAAMLAKVLRYVGAPEHFRWELYPVPHEKGRAEYGGSYLEELDWWSQPRHAAFLRELREMAVEIFLLKGVFRHNRKVWRFSWPFHMGLYISIGWLGLLLIGAIVEASGGSVSGRAGGFGSIIHLVTIITGYVGMSMAGIGAFGLLIWRLTDRDQRPYNAPIDYFNLAFFVLVIALALAGHLTLDPSFTALKAYVTSLVKFSSPPAMPAVLAAEIVLGSLLLAYIPLTRMSHFVAKYFLYHAVRWNDIPSERGGKIERRIAAMLLQRVGWKASHIQTGQTWTDVVKEMKNEKPQA